MCQSKQACSSPSGWIGSRPSRFQDGNPRRRLALAATSAFAASLSAATASAQTVILIPTQTTRDNTGQTLNLPDDTILRFQGPGANQSTFVMPGRLFGGRVTATGNGHLDIPDLNGGFIDSVTVAAPVRVGATGRLDLNDVVLENTVITLGGAGARIGLTGGLTGTGQITLNGNSTNQIHAHTTPALPADLIIRTGTGGGSITHTSGLVNPLLLQGTIIADTPGSTFRLLGTFINEGRLEVRSGVAFARFLPGPALANRGTFVLEDQPTFFFSGTNSNAGGTLNLINTPVEFQGNLPAGALGTINRTGASPVTVKSATLAVTATAPLDLAAAGGDVRFVGNNTINGGAGAVITGNDNARLLVDAFNGITFNGITLNAPLVATLGFTSFNGGVVNAPVIVGGAATVSLRNNWVNNSTFNLQPGGTLDLSGNFSTPSVQVNRTGGTLLINGTLNNASQTLDLTQTGTIQLSFNGRITGGTVSGNAANHLRAAGSNLLTDVRIETPLVTDKATVTFQGSWQNNGGITATNGSFIILNGTPANLGTFDLDASTAAVQIPLTTSQLGAFTTRNGGVVALLAGGSIDNTNATLHLTTDRPLVLQSGRLRGGTVTGDAGVSLVVRRTNAPLVAGASPILENVTLNAPLLIDGRSAGIEGTLTSAVRKSITIASGTTAATAASLSLPTDFTLANAEVVFDGASSAPQAPHLTGSNGYTLAPDVTVRTGAGSGRISSMNNGTVHNLGFIQSRTPERRITVSRLNNQGTVEARDGGTIYFSTPAEVLNLSSGALTGGKWNVSANSTLTIDGASITTNAADVTLSGLGSTFEPFHALNRNDGRFAILDDRDFLPASDFLNTGTLEVGIDSTFRVADDFTQTGQGRLQIHVDHSGGAGVLIGAATATVDGTLELVVDPSYAPPLGEIHYLVASPSLSGTFDQSVASPLPNGLTWELFYTPTNVAIQAVPEPAASTMVLLALAACVRRRRTSRSG